MVMGGFFYGFWESHDYDKVKISRGLYLRSGRNKEGSALGQLQFIQGMLAVAEYSERLELDFMLDYQVGHSLEVVDALRDVAGSITGLLVGVNFPSFAQVALPMVCLTRLSLIMPKDDNEGLKTVTAIQSLHTLQDVAVHVEWNAKQLPALLHVLASLTGLSELAVSTNSTMSLSLALSSLQHVTNLQIGSHVEFVQPPPNLFHLHLEHIDNPHMMEALSRACLV